MATLAFTVFATAIALLSLLITMQQSNAKTAESVLNLERQINEMQFSRPLPTPLASDGPCESPPPNLRSHHGNDRHSYRRGAEK